MQTTHTTTHAPAYGHTRTLSVRRRPGMSGAYVRHRINPDSYWGGSQDTGWVYWQDYKVFARWATKYKKDLFEVLYPA